MRFLLSATIILLTTSLLLGQQTRLSISGTVLDSATLTALPYVAIQLKGKGIGLSSSENGSFSINCEKTDTLVFTRLGYKPLLLLAKNIRPPVSVIMAEDANMLKGITVYDKLDVQGAEEWRKDLPVNTRIRLKEQSLEPEAGSIATFGPGLQIPLGGGKDKTKNKRDEISRTAVYRSTVYAPETKERIIKLYTISEETFYRKLEKFNRESPEAAYLTDSEEIITMLIQFFAFKE